MDYRLLSVFALALWGAWGFLAKVISSSISPQSLAFWSTVATVIPVAVFAFTESTGKWVRPHPLAVGAGLAYGLALVFFFTALKRGPASVVVPLSGGELGTVTYYGAMSRRGTTGFVHRRIVHRVSSDLHIVVRSRKNRG